MLWDKEGVIWFNDILTLEDDLMPYPVYIYKLDIYIYIYIYIYIHIKLPWPENPASTSCDIRNHWTAVLTVFGLISRVYRDLDHWISNQ